MKYSNSALLFIITLLSSSVQAQEVPAISDRYAKTKWLSTGDYVPVGMTATYSVAQDSTLRGRVSRVSAQYGDTNPWYQFSAENFDDSVVLLDAKDEYVYIQAERSSDKFKSLKRCLLVGCEVLREEAADPRAIQMGLPSHTMNQQGTVFTWYQDQSLSPRINRLSFFTSSEHALLTGDGYVTGISEPASDSIPVYGLASFDERPIIARESNAQSQWWYLPSGAFNHLVPVAIDGNEYPRVVLLNKTEDGYGSIVLCDVVLPSDSRKASCNNGLQDTGFKAKFNLGWYLDNQGNLFANQVVDQSDPEKNNGIVLDTHNLNKIPLKTLAASVFYLPRLHYLYTSASGDVLIREETPNQTRFAVLEADYNGDRLGDSWAASYPGVDTKPYDDPDNDGLSTFMEYRWGSHPLKADADKDGLNDSEERVAGTDPFRSDSDRDGLSDPDELANGTNPNNRDTDGDGVSDYVDDFPTDPDRQVDYQKDSDGDGIPDYIEDQTPGIVSYRADSNLDLDQDGLSCLQEYRLGTNLTVADSDLDGMPDGFEVSNQLDPLDSADGLLTEDKDADGWANILEYRAGTAVNDESEQPDRAVQVWSAASLKSRVPVSTGPDVVAADGSLYLISKGKLIALSESGVEKWSVNTTEYYPRPTVTNNGHVIVPDTNELRVLSSEGDELWRLPGKWEVSLGEQDNIYLAAAGILKKVDSGGAVIWEKTGSFSRALVSYGRIYVKNKENITAYDLNGESLWLFPGRASEFIVDPQDLSLIVVQSNKISRVSSEGDLISQKSLSYSYSDMALSLDGDSNVYLFPQYGDTTLSLDKNFVQRWRKELCNSYSCSVDSDGSIYRSASRNLVKYNNAGEVLWSVRADRELHQPVIFGKNKVYSGGRLFQIPVRISEKEAPWQHSGGNYANSYSLCRQADSDCDGMTDDYEEQNELNFLQAETFIDRDIDGLTNYQEYIFGTDPNAKDSDGDQIPDLDEIHFGLNPTVFDSSEDLDADGYSNLEEYQLGSHPADDRARPVKDVGQFLWSSSIFLEYMAADDDGNIFGYSGGKIVKIDYRGNLVWSVRSEALSQEIMLPSDSEVAWISSGSLNIVSSEDGSPVRNLIGGYTHFAKSKDGYILSGSEAGTGFTLSYVNFSGDLIWKKTIDINPDLLVVNGNGVIYVNHDGYYVSAYGPAGDFLWRDAVGAYSHGAYSVKLNGSIMVSAKDVAYTISEDGSYEGVAKRFNSTSVYSSFTDISLKEIYSSRSQYNLMLSEYDGENRIAVSTYPGVNSVLYYDNNKALVTDWERYLLVSNGSTIGEFSHISDMKKYTSKFDVVVTRDRMIVTRKYLDKIETVAYYLPDMKGIWSWSKHSSNIYNTYSVCGMKDSDCDGLNDDRELLLGLDPDVKDLNADKDNDGISNVDELAMGSDINSRDTDSDGIEDYYEIVLGLNILINDSALDADGDGFSNLEEYLVGSDINDPLATPSDDNATIRWQKEFVGRGYVYSHNALYASDSESIIKYDNEGNVTWRTPYYNNINKMMLLSERELAVLYPNSIFIYSTVDGEKTAQIDGEFEGLISPGRNEIYAIKDSTAYVYQESDNYSVVKNYFPAAGSGLKLYAKRSGQVCGYRTQNVSCSAFEGKSSWFVRPSRSVTSMVFDNNDNSIVYSVGQLDKFDDVGNHVWKTSLNNFSSASVVNFLSSIFYVADYNGNVAAINDNGEFNWSINISRNRGSGISVDRSGYLYFLSENESGQIDLTRISPEGNVEYYPVPQPGNSYSDLDIVDGAVYLFTHDKLVKAYYPFVKKGEGWYSNKSGHNRGSLCGLLDSDCDGLSDHFELNKTLNPYVNDVLGDYDGDGINNATEIILGSNMHSSDTDSDEIPDWFEHHYNIGITIANAGVDADSDGYSNIQEYLEESSPVNPDFTARKEDSVFRWKVIVDSSCIYSDEEENIFYVNKENGVLSKINKYGHIRWESKIIGSEYVSNCKLEEYQGNLLLKENNQLILFGSSEGDQLWRIRRGVKDFVSSGENIYIINGYVIDTLDGNGNVINSYRAGSSPDYISRIGHRYLGVVQNRYLYVFQGATEVWQYQTSDRKNIEKVLYVNGDIVILTEDSLIKLSESGIEKLNKKLPRQFDFIEAGADGTLYLANRGGDVEVYDVGFDIKFSQRFHPIQSIAAGKDGVSYFAGTGGYTKLSAEGVVTNLPVTDEVRSIRLLDNAMMIVTADYLARVYNSGLGEVEVDDLSDSNDDGQVKQENPRK